MQIESCQVKFNPHPQNLQEAENCLKSPNLTSDGSESSSSNLKRKALESTTFSERLYNVESTLSNKIQLYQPSLKERLIQHLASFSDKELIQKDVNLKTFKSSNEHKTFTINSKYYALVNENGEILPDITDANKLYIRWANQRMIQELIALYFSVIQVSHPLIDKSAFESRKGCRSQALIYAMCAYSVKFSCNEEWMNSPRWLISKRFFDASRKAISESNYLPSQANMQALNMLGTLCFEDKLLSSNLIGSSIKMGQQLNCAYIISPESQELLKNNPNEGEFKERCRAWMFCLEMERISSLILHRPFMQKFRPSDGGTHIMNLTIPINLEEISASSKSKIVNVANFQLKMIDQYVNIIHHFFFSLRLLTQEIVNNKKESKKENKYSIDLLNYIQKLYFTFVKLNTQLPNPKLRLMMKGFTSYARALLSTLTIIYFFPETFDPQIKSLTLNVSSTSRAGKRILNRCVTAASQMVDAAKIIKERRSNQRVSSALCLDFYVSASFLIKLNNSNLETQQAVPKGSITILFDTLHHLSSYWAFSKVLLENLSKLSP